MSSGPLKAKQIEVNRLWCHSNCIIEKPVKIGAQNWLLKWLFDQVLWQEGEGVGPNQQRSRDVNNGIQRIHDYAYKLLGQLVRILPVEINYL